MKGRLGSTIWILVVVNLVAMLAVLGLAYSAGAYAKVPLLDAFNASSEALIRLLGAGAALVLVSLALVLVLGNKVLTPVKELTEFSEKLAGGDYRARADVDSNDDFGLIAENFNRSAEKVSKAVVNQEAQETLQRSVTEFLTITSQIARGDLTLRGKVTNDALGNVVDSVNYMLDNFTKVLERVRNAAIDVSSSANQILVSSEQMSSGATQQDQEITNTSSAVEELTVSMKQVSNNAEASAEAARRALDAAEQGNRSVRDTLEGMQRIRASVQATAKKIKSLGDRSLEISEIINVINDITEQTNLLALNAAIEAARAGDAGRGFAVVADEVRKLAERSVEAAKEIGEVVRQVQQETTDAVEVARSGAAEAKQGMTLADKAGAALRNIIESVSRSSALMEKIADATGKQSQASSEVLETVARMNSATTHVTQAVKEQAEGSKQRSEEHTSELQSPTKLV